MFDESEIIAHIETRLESCKQWKDDYGIDWVEVNGKAFPKKQMICACMENEKLEMMKEKLNFLEY